MNQDLVDWLLEEDQPSVRYYTLLDLLGRKENDPEVREAYSKIPRRGWAKDILELQKPGGYWEPNEPASPTEENVLRRPANFLRWLNFLFRPGYVTTNWRALVLSDLGLTSKDRRIGKIADLFFRFHFPVHYHYDILVGLDFITKLGYADDRRLRPALRILKDKRQPDGTWLLDKVHPDRGAGTGYDPNLKKVKPLALEEAGKPSKWITLTALRILKRVKDAS